MRHKHETLAPELRSSRRNHILGTMNIMSICVVNTLVYNTGGKKTNNYPELKFTFSLQS